MTDFEFWSYQNIMRAVAVRQDIKDLILDAADRLLNQFGYKKMTKGLPMTRRPIQFQGGVY